MTDSILTSYQHQTTVTHVPFPAAPPTGFPITDYPGAVGAYSFRKLKQGYLGSAVRIRRDSDQAEQDIGFVVSDFDTTGASTFITGAGAATGFITKWYDQSGNGFDLFNTTAASQPTYNATGLNSKPTMSAVFSPNNQKLITAAAAPQLSSGSTLFVLGNFDWTTRDDYQPILRFTNNSTFLQREFSGDGTSPNKLEAASQNTGATLFRANETKPANANYLLTAYVDGTAVSLYRNNVLVGGPTAITGSINSSSGDVMNMNTDGATSFGDNLYSEIILYASAQANRSSIDVNMRAYWGL